MNSQFYSLQNEKAAKTKCRKMANFYGEFDFDHARNSPFFATDTPQ